MSIDPLNPFGTSPQFATVPPSYQPVQPPFRPQPQSSQIATNKQFVSGGAGIKNMTLPHGVFAFFDNDRPILYDTAVDELGKKDVTAYEVRRIEPPTPEELEAMQPITKGDMQGLLKRVDDIQAQLSDLKKLNGGLE